jgi:hypothetical protein
VSPEVVQLDPSSIELIADAVAERLTARGIATEYMTAEEIALEHRVGVGWVYAHKLELGAEPLGSGRKPRLRFRRDRVESFFAAAAAGPSVDAARPAPAPKRKPRPIGRVELLPIRGRSR